MPVEPPAAAPGGIVTPPSWTSPLLQRAGVRHAFFGRRGGVSTGIYTSLNAGPGSDDDGAAVAENRQRIAEAMGAGHASFVTMNQQHTAIALVVEGPWAGRWPPCDAVVTTVAGLALGVLTADCAPVLLAAPAAGVVGAAHAGWRGAIGGVLEAVLTAMRGLGGGEIVAAIGPTIQQQSYEVGPEFAARFLADDAANADFFAPGEGDRRHFDLPAYCRRRLERAGVAAVELLENDTCAEAGDFFSNRRAVKQGEPDYGRNCAVIRLPD
jgi:YfiH family protein